MGNRNCGRARSARGLERYWIATPLGLLRFLAFFNGANYSNSYIYMLWTDSQTGYHDVDRWPVSHDSCGQDQVMRNRHEPIRDAPERSPFRLHRIEQDNNTCLRYANNLEQQRQAQVWH